MNEGGTPYSPKRLKTTRWGTRAAAWALVAALLIPMLNWARVYAAETPEGGLCVHHPAHTPDCGQPWVSVQPQPRHRPAGGPGLYPRFRCPA